MEYEIYRTDDELIHWGIRGMKWGQRRYQNKDGSLTPAGKKRYQKEMEALKKEEAILKKRKATRAKIERLEAKRKAIEDEKKALDDDDKATDKKSKVVDDKSAKKAIAKSIKDMSDEELSAAINRARMEDDYRRLRPEQQVERHPLMKKMLNDVVMPAAVNSGKKFLEDALTKVGKNLLGDKVDPNSIEALTKVRDKLKLNKEIKDLKKGDPSLKDMVKELNELSDDELDVLARAAGVQYYRQGILSGKGIKPDKGSNKKKDNNNRSDNDNDDDDDDDWGQV